MPKSSSRLPPTSTSSVAPTSDHRFGTATTTLGAPLVPYARPETRPTFCPACRRKRNCASGDHLRKVFLTRGRGHLQPSSATLSYDLARCGWVFSQWNITVLLRGILVALVA